MLLGLQCRGDVFPSSPAIQTKPRCPCTPPPPPPPPWAWRWTKTREREEKREPGWPPLPRTPRPGSSTSRSRGNQASATAATRPGVPRFNAQRARFMGGRARSLLRWFRHRSRRVSSSSFPLTTTTTSSGADPHARSLPHQFQAQPEEEVDEQEDNEEDEEEVIVLQVCGAAGTRAPVRTQPPRMDSSKKVPTRFSVPYSASSSMFGFM